MIIQKSTMHCMELSIKHLHRSFSKIVSYPPKETIENRFNTHPSISDYTLKAGLHKYVATAFANQKLSSLETDALLEKTLEDWNKSAKAPVEALHVLKSIVQGILANMPSYKI